MKRNYEAPECIVDSLIIEDVMTASGSNIEIGNDGYLEDFV